MEVLLALIAIAVAFVAVYVAVKAHQHNASLAAELKNQEGKIQNVVAAVEAKLPKA